jgi:lipopolysaccharide biosynthesis glycosyltransferase
MNMALMFALNDKFILSMQVFLLSILRTNPWFNSDILLLSDGDLSDMNLSLLKNIYPRIVKIDAKRNDYTGCMPTTQVWGYNLFYRFDVFEMGHLGYERIIIMDSDMVVLKDISELLTYNYDFASCEKHLGIPEIGPDDPRIRDRKRFNCGLMSISKKILRPYYKDKLIRIASSRSWSSDQPVFNVCFENTVDYLPQKFNVVSSIATEKNLKEACIIQYHGFIKPWHSSDASKCFEPFVLEELEKTSLNVQSTSNTLKQIFDEYAILCSSSTQMPLQTLNHTPFL